MFPWCGGVVVAKMLALYAFARSYTPPSQDKAGFTYPDSPQAELRTTNETGIYSKQEYMTSTVTTPTRGASPRGVG